MNRTRRSVQLLALVMALPGCVGHVSYPDQFRLCRTKANVDGWGISEVYEQEIKAIGKVRFHLHLNDVVDNTNAVFDDGVGYWIRITGFTEGRKSFSGFQFSGIREKIPMMYSINDAYIEMTGGGRVYAEKEIHFGASENPDVPGSELVAQPIDLNSDEVHSRNNRNSLGAYRSVYVRFPIRHPKTSDTWNIHLGLIELGGTKVAIPNYQLCFYPGRSEFFIHKGAF